MTCPHLQHVHGSHEQPGSASFVLFQLPPSPAEICNLASLQLHQTWELCPGLKLTLSSQVCEGRTTLLIGRKAGAT